MIHDFQTFQDLFNRKKIEMTESCFNFLIQKFQFVYIQADTANIFNSANIIESNFIIIDENINYNDTKEDYYILCFISRQKYTLLIIKQSDINLIQTFLTQNNRIRIYYLRNKEQEKLHSIFNNIMIENLSIYFEQEISNFNSRFSLKNPSLTTFWNAIKNNISGFLIKKSYEDSFFERIGQLPRKFDPKPQVLEMSEDEFIFLRHLNKNYISVKLIYHIQKGQIFVRKIQSEDEKDKLIEREKQNYLNIDHLFIPKYYGYGEAFGRNFIVFEYINGHNLNEIKKLQLSKSDKISIIYELIMVFQYIHNKGLIYRDLKPDNVIIDKNKTAVLIDFDRLISNPTDFTQITVDFAHKYHAPEIVLGSFTNSCDIYSLGLIIYYIMTEKEPMIDLENPSETLTDFPSEFPELKKICEKCIQKDPRKRYESKKLGDIFFNYCLYNNEVNMQTKGKILDIFDSILFYEKRKCEYSSLLYDVAIHYYKYEIPGNLIFRSFKYFEYSANLNNLQSQIIIGEYYYEYKNYNKAVYYLTMAANRNEPEAQYKLGSIYYHNLKEINKSFYYFNLSSNQNNPNAQYELALIYLKGQDVKQDVKKALYLLNSSANQNNPNAQYELACLYLDGYFVEKNFQKAIDLFTSLANQGFVKAQLKLVDIYLKYKTPQYFPKAIHFCKLASEQNNRDAQYYLGAFHLHGVCCEKNVNKAINYLTLSANQNHADALYMLGEIYSIGKVVNRDINKSFKFFSRAAQQNHEGALFSLGCLYEKGIGVERDIYKAIKYFSIAAEYKHEGAMFNLAVFYYNGIYIKQDINKSISLLTYLANLNNSDAQLFLGKIYLESENVRQNAQNVLKYLSLSASQNNEKAQYILGRCYLDGIITPRDIDRSIYYLELAAKQNFIEAYYTLGHIYFEVLKKEYNKGLKYFKQAADANNPSAQYTMGYLYYEGRYVERDINKAFHYFKLSADQKNRFAQYRLGLLYKNGEYVKYDLNKAIYYLTLAANQNDSESQFVLACIYLDSENLDLKKAFNYLTLAADQNNHRDAQYCLAIIYFEGYAIKRDIKKAIFYFKETSSMSNQYSKNNLGIIYKLGDGVDKNISMAIEYFNEAINRNNDSAAMFNLAHIYLYEEGVKFDLDKAIGLLIKATLFENNFAFNLLKLAFIKKYKNVSKLDIENELKNNGVKKIDKMVNQIYYDILKKNMTNPNFFMFMYEINKDINLVYDINFRYKQINIKIEKKSQMTSKSYNEINSDFYAGFEV